MSLSRFSLGRVAAACTLGATMFMTVVAPARAADDQWRFSITPYLWIPSVDTTLGTDKAPGITVETDSGPSDVFDKLDLPVLLCGEIRKGKLGLLYDFQYLQFSNDGTTGVTNRRDFDVNFTFVDATLDLEYRVIDEPERFSLDVLGGARMVYAKTEIDLASLGPVPASSREQDRTWVDPVVGLRTQWSLNKQWSLGAYADVGGFGVGSDFTCLVMGVIAFHFNEHVALQAGYRYFYVDYDQDDLNLEAHIYGPVIGLTISF